MDSLQGNPPALELPLLRARGSDQAYRAARADLDVAALANAAPETLLSGWLAMLYRTTRQGDLVTGVAEAGGRVLPLRFELTGELSFTDLLTRRGLVLRADLLRAWGSWVSERAVVSAPRAVASSVPIPRSSAISATARYSAPVSR